MSKAKRTKIEIQGTVIAIAALDLYQVMRATGQIETALGLTSRTRYGP